MARRVKVRSSVRGVSARYNACAYCEENGLHARFDFPIGRALTDWEEYLGPDALDRALIRLLKEALQLPSLMEQIEDDLRRTYNLSEEWEADDAMWDQYREALAVCLLQHYYDHHHP